jgi:hypothetical protein
VSGVPLSPSVVDVSGVVEVSEPASVVLVESSLELEQAPRSATALTLATPKQISNLRIQVSFA